MRCALVLLTVLPLVACQTAEQNIIKEKDSTTYFSDRFELTITSKDKPYEGLLLDAYAKIVTAEGRPPSFYLIIQYYNSKTNLQLKAGSPIEIKYDSTARQYRSLEEVSHHNRAEVPAMLRGSFIEKIGTESIYAQSLLFELAEEEFVSVAKAQNASFSFQKLQGIFNESAKLQLRKNYLLALKDKA